MDLFSISQLSRYSGIKSHTIRMWEHRYNGLKPHRSDGNTRYYNNEQLRRLLNIVSLMKSDYKISELCSLSDKQLILLLENLDQAKNKNDLNNYYVSQLIAAGISFDEAGFDKIFSHSLLRYGMKETYQKIIYPLLVRIGLMWGKDQMPVGSEHFLSNLIRQKLLTAIDGLPLPQLKADRWILFLPENEFHETGLLFAQYLIRLSGRTAIYIGANLPAKALKEIVQNVQASAILMFLVHQDLSEASQDAINILNQQAGQKKVMIAGKPNHLNQLSKGSKIIRINSVEALEKQFN